MILWTTRCGVVALSITLNVSLVFRLCFLSRSPFFALWPHSTYKHACIHQRAFNPSPFVPTCTIILDKHTLDAMHVISCIDVDENSYLYCKLNGRSNRRRFLVKPVKFLSKKITVRRCTSLYLSRYTQWRTQRMCSRVVPLTDIKNNTQKTEFFK